MFSEPQPKLQRLVDLSLLDWQPLTTTDAGLSINANCKVATLDAFGPPVAWPAARLIGKCCRSFLASFKIWNMATVGGNLCMSLPAGPMISLTAALEGVCTIWSSDGSARKVPVVDFVKGPLSNDLRPGECCAVSSLPWEAAFTQDGISPGEPYPARSLGRASHRYALGQGRLRAHGHRFDAPTGAVRIPAPRKRPRTGAPPRKRYSGRALL